MPCLALSYISFSTSAPPPPHSLLKLLLCSLNSSSSLQPLPCWCWSSLLLLSFCSSPPHLVQSLLKCPVMERGVCHQVYRRLAAHLWGVLSAGSLQRSSRNQGCPPLQRDLPCPSLCPPQDSPHARINYGQIFKDPAVSTQMRQLGRAVSRAPVDSAEIVELAPLFSFSLCSIPVPSQVSIPRIQFDKPPSCSPPLSDKGETLETQLETAHL